MVIYLLNLRTNHVNYASASVPTVKLRYVRVEWDHYVKVSSWAEARKTFLESKNHSKFFPFEPRNGVHFLSYSQRLASRSD